MDVLTETNNMLANTKQQPLSYHLFAVGFTAFYLLKTLNIQHPTLQQSAFIAGILHDIGKIDPKFQEYIAKKSKKASEDYLPEDGEHIDKPQKYSFENHPRHNEISWLLSHSLLIGSDKHLNAKQYTQIYHGIYWHHTRPFRKEDKFTSAEAIYALFKKSLGQKTISNLYQKSLSVLNNLKTLAEQFNVAHLVPQWPDSFQFKKAELPNYKKYNDWNDEIHEYKANLQENALNNLVRAAVISADRLVSSCSKEDLAEYLAEGSLRSLVDRQADDRSLLLRGIEKCLYGFEATYPNSARNKSQTIAANKLAELQRIATLNESNESANISVLQGPAGCGKTKIALEWALKTNAKKIIWVCPRVQVCLGLLNDLTQSDYLPNNQIEIFTGEYKKILSNGVPFDDAPDTEEADFFSGNIVITTIDQVINAVITHQKVTTMIDLLQAHVVFDEFHELITIPAINLLFSELILAKRQQGAQANTLLVSATPNYFFLNHFLDILSEDIISIESFNTSRYQITFDHFDEKNSTNPLLARQTQKNTFVISNTAQDAQLGFLMNHQEENSVLIHSRYTKQDKIYWFQQVFNAFKKEGNKRFSILRSGPIIQASLNISCDHMMTELTSAENWLQRLGRLDRFGLNKTVNQYITVVPGSVKDHGKQTSSCARFLNQLCVWQSAKAWYDYLQQHLKQDIHISINELYQLYRSFYASLEVQKVIEADLLLSLKKSAKLIKQKVFDPISIPPKSKQNQTLKISANSLRGNSCFVQMACCSITDNLQLSFEDAYAYDEKIDLSQPLPCLTESIDRIRGFDIDEKNLVDFMLKKHHNIKKDSGYKKARNEWELIKAARSPETPIYLSYTSSDLKPVGGTRVAHSQAIYYVTCDKQVIGAMPIEKLKTIQATAKV